MKSYQVAMSQACQEKEWEKVEAPGGKVEWTTVSRFQMDY